MRPKEVKPFRVLKVHFETQESLTEFARILEQRLNAETSIAWFPKMTVERYRRLVFGDES